MLVRSRAPLRIGLAGGGTDLSPFCDRYGGFILNATINMFAYCTIETRSDDLFCFHASDRDSYCETKISDKLQVPGDAGFLAGVYQNFLRRMGVSETVPLNLVTYCDSPPGSGLGSSSTLVVAIVHALSELLRIPLGDYDLAHLAYQIERLDLGLQGGRQDQYAAAFGGINFIEFYEKDRVIVNPLRVKEFIRSELESSLILYYTGRSRSSASIVMHQVDRIEAFEKKSIEAMQSVKEEAIRMKEALLKGEMHKLASILRKGWKAKKETAQQVSNPDIEKIFDLALNNGAIAGKVSGAGGGGFIMFLVDPTKRAQLTGVLKKQVGIVHNCSITEMGSQAWRVR